MDPLTAMAIMAALTAGSTAYTADVQEKSGRRIVAQREEMARKKRVAEVNRLKMGKEADQSRQVAADAQARAMKNRALRSRSIKPLNAGADISAAVLNEGA